HTRFSRDWSSDVCSSDLDGHEYRHYRGIVDEGGYYREYPEQCEQKQEWRSGLAQQSTDARQRAAVLQAGGKDEHCRYGDGRLVAEAAQCLLRVDQCEIGRAHV